MLKKFIPLTIFFLLCSCSSTFRPIFQVKPRQEVPLLEASNKASNIVVEVEAKLLPEDLVVEIFDGNLFLAGTIPIQITLTNKSQLNIAFMEKDFSLLSSQGETFTNLKAEDAFESLFDYYKIRAYNPYSYEKVKEDFLTHRLKLKDPFLPNESRSGLLFFKTKKAKTIPKNLQLKLTGKKLFSESLILHLD